MKHTYLKSRFLQFLELRIKKNWIFLHQKLLLFWKINIQNVDKNCKNNASDALGFVILALLWASKKPVLFGIKLWKSDCIDRLQAQAGMFFHVRHFSPRFHLFLKFVAYKLMHLARVPEFDLDEATAPISDMEGLKRAFYCCQLLQSVFHNLIPN